MLQKESVNRRLESEDGISFTEFSYLLLQAYDFLELFDRYGCTLQMGGSDQWGNITAGIDLIRKLRGDEGARPGVPLMTTAAGTKFGKTEAGTIWLDPERTSPFQFYQFWLNTDDRDVVAYLKFFTFLDRDGDRGARGRDDARAGKARGAARARARGDDARARRRAGGARGACVGGAVRRGHRDAARSTTCWRCSTMCRRPSCRRTSSTATASALVDLVARVQLAPSKSEARRLVQSGGVYVNNRRMSDPQARLTRDRGDWRASCSCCGRGRSRIIWCG